MQLPYSNLQISHQNPGASMPLVLPIHLICNTSDEALFENIRVNSRRPGKWVAVEPAHEHVAVLCGSGPSLADSLDEIRAMAAEGAVIFAMNGAAKFLHDNGLTPDFQVIIDAREETAQLVGPAYQHLFGSQVHPACFEKAPRAQVWHLQIEGIEDHFPSDYDGRYCLIGGAASVGNCATCLTYAMGFREMHCFGYDSSHRGDAGHAFPQPLNNGDPCCFVKFNGKDYRASLTMKLQAEKFMDTSRELAKLGVKLHVHGDGLLPAMFNDKLSEQAKYELMWAEPKYHEVAPGEQIAATFVQVTRPEGTVIDFGCGTGRGALEILRLTECKLHLVDFTLNSRSPEAKLLPFTQADLSQPIPVKGDHGFCTDVMEHIPPEQVESVIHNIMACVPQCFFMISLIPDNLGGLIGHPLHLTVESYGWWSKLFRRLGYTVTWSRDYVQTALFHIKK